MCFHRMRQNRRSCWVPWSSSWRGPAWESSQHDLTLSWPSTASSSMFLPLTAEVTRSAPLFTRHLAQHAYSMLVMIQHTTLPAALGSTCIQHTGYVTPLFMKHSTQHACCTLVMIQYVAQHKYNTAHYSACCFSYRVLLSRPVACNSCNDTQHTAQQTCSMQLIIQ